MNDDGGNNWLRSAFIECPNCHEKLFRVDHSPMIDDHLLYCDHCARNVEVDIYDPVTMEIYRRLSESKSLTRESLMMEIEARLRSCDCGGRYKDEAPRRCHKCLFQVIRGER